MADKRKLLGTIMAKMEAAHKGGHHLEAAWYAYAILEDRLRSALRTSGGERGGPKNKPLRMAGEKLGELIERAAHSSVISQALPLTDLKAWVKSRNDLMHSMLDGSMTEHDIGRSAQKLSSSGLALVKKLAVSTMRLKKHRNQTPSVSTSASKVTRASKGAKKRGAK